MENETRYTLPRADLGEGTMRTCTIGGREVLICHAKGGIYAVDNICTHAYARLSEGRLRGTRLICPLHGASFDVRDGRTLGPPAIQGLKVYTVQLTESAIEVSVP